MWLILILFGLSIYLLVRYLSGNQNYWTKLGINSITTDSSTLMRVLTNAEPIDFEIEMFKKLNGQPFAGMVELRSPQLIVTDPALIKAIMIKDFDCWADRKDFTADEFFGKMLFAMNGPEWKAMRKIMTPTFTSSKIRTMFEIFHENNLIFMKHLQNETKQSKLIDISKYFGRYTLAVINSVAFGVKSDTIENENSYYLTMANKMKKFSLPKFVLLTVAPWAFRLFRLKLIDQESLGFFMGMVKSAIKMRQESGEKRNDFIQLMLDVRAENNSQESNLVKDKKLTDEEICAQSIQFLFDGFDAVESLMVSACAQMAIYPDMQEKIYQEAKRSADENNGLITYDSLQSKAYDYLDAFLQELQRLYPIAYYHERVSTVDYKLPEYSVTVPKGTVVHFPTYMIQRDPKNFENPEKFQPERFLTENKENSSAYLPFGLGPRACIGRRFALTETKAMIANLLLNFKLEPSAQMEIPVKYSAKAGSFKAVSSTILRFEPRK